MYLPFAETFVNPCAVILIGLGAGILVRVLGPAGYLVLAPCLNVFGVPSATAAGTTCALLLSAGVAATFADAPAPRAARPALILAAAAGLAGAAAGQHLLLALRDLDLAAPVLRLAYAAALLAAFALLVRRAGSGAGHGPRRPGAETAAALAAGLTLGAAAMHPAALHPAGTPATGAGVKGPGTGAPYLFLPAALWATYAYGAAGAVELGLWALLALGLVLGAHLGGLLRRHRGAALGGGAFGAALPAFALALLLRQFQLTAAAGYLVLLTVLGLMLATGWLLAGTLSSGTAEAPKVEENKRIL